MLPKWLFLDINDKLKSQKFIRKIVSTESVQTNRGSDFNPSPGYRIILKLECGHHDWVAGSRYPRSGKRDCCLCRNNLANQIYRLAQHADIRSGGSGVEAE